MNLESFQEKFSGKEWPQCNALLVEGASAEVSIYTNPDICWFEGHFPGQPVLAGVVQTHWVALWAQTLFSIDSAFRGIDNLKFQSVILPSQDVEITLAFDSEKSIVKFNFHCNDQICSEGRLRF